MRNSFNLPTIVHIQVALKLLDCDFPDEKVREFATRVLEELPDERLDDFLLQLTQVGRESGARSQLGWIEW